MGSPIGVCAGRAFVELIISNKLNQGLDKAAKQVESFANKQINKRQNSFPPSLSPLPSRSR